MSSEPSFKPPKDNPLFIAACKAFLPLHMKFQLDTDVEIYGEGLKRYKQMRGNRMVICVNHSDHNDPDILFALAKMTDDEYRFVAAREVFDYYHGILGLSFQMLGVYSVVRGVADHQSFEMTKKVIAHDKKRLVVFPEGEISNNNDVLLPIRPGMIRLFFEAFEEARLRDRNDDIYLQPIGLKWIYKEDIQYRLSECIAKLEDATNILATSDSLIQRTRKVAETMIGTFEREYNFSMDEDVPLGKRIAKFKTLMLQGMADTLKVELNPEDSHLDWVRVIRNELDNVVHADETEMSEYERKIHEEKSRKVKGYYRDLRRIVNVIAVYEGYLAPPITQERLASVVGLMEEELFGKRRSKGHRTAILNIGNSINLANYLGPYERERHRTTQVVAHDLTRALTALLEEVENSRKKIMVS